MGEYRRHAVTEIDRLHQEHRIPLVVGGTGLYVRALLRGLWPGPPVDWTLRRQLEQEAQERGLAALYQEHINFFQDLPQGLTLSSDPKIHGIAGHEFWTLHLIQYI